MTHFAFVYGDIGDGEEILTRLHRSDFSQDVLSGAREIRASLDKIAEAGAGVLIYLRDGAAGVPTSKPGRASSDTRRREQWREVGLGAQILRELGVKSIRELASHERSFVGLHGFGIEIRSTVII